MMPLVYEDLVKELRKNPDFCRDFDKCWCSVVKATAKTTTTITGTFRGFSRHSEDYGEQYSGIQSSYYAHIKVGRDTKKIKVSSIKCVEFLKPPYIGYYNTGSGTVFYGNKGIRQWRRGFIGFSNTNCVFLKGSENALIPAPVNYFDEILKAPIKYQTLDKVVVEHRKRPHDPFSAALSPDIAVESSNDVDIFCTILYRGATIGYIGGEDMVIDKHFYGMVASLSSKPLKDINIKEVIAI